VTVIKKGGYFGELALVTHKPRAATARASGRARVACKLMAITLQFFPQLLRISNTFINNFIFKEPLKKYILIFLIPNLLFSFSVLEVHAFERLLGPCMDVMKRNIDDYEAQLVRIFGSRTNISGIR